MYAVPDVDDVIATAKSLGISLGPDEAVLYRKYLLQQMDGLDSFVQSRIEEVRPPMVSRVRGPAYLPTAEEDPLNAWRWKCRIEGDGSVSNLLAGKTVSYKDHIAVAGVPMSLGSFGMEGFIPDFDATIVTKTLAAGGTIIGKNTQAGLSGGLANGGRFGDYGRPLNPHSPDHTPGGSSSGSGAAVAAGKVDISFGGDQGGSIRLPAAYCGTYGLKPTFGLISHFGVGFGSDQSIDYVGPLARTAEDAAKALQATAGYDPYDPRSTRDVPVSMDVLSGLKDGVSGLRVGVLDEGFIGCDPEVRDLVMAAVNTLQAAGAIVSKVSVAAHTKVMAPWMVLMGDGAWAIFKTSFFGAWTRTYYPASFMAAINQFWASHADMLAPRTKLSLITGELSRKSYNGRVYAKAQNLRPTFIHAYDAVLAGVDVLVMPTAPNLPPKVVTQDTYLEGLQAALANHTFGPMIMNTAPFNYTGHPALAVPVGKSASGLPASMQLVGRFFDDALLMKVAYAYEQAATTTSVLEKTPELVGAV